NSVIGMGDPRRRFGSAGYRSEPARVGGYLIMSAQIADGQWLNIASAIRGQSPVLIRSLLFQTVVIYLILLIPLIWLGRYISRPLKKLTKRSEEHTSELQSRENLVCRLLLEKKTVNGGDLRMVLLLALLL